MICADATEKEIETKPSAATKQAPLPGTESVADDALKMRGLLPTYAKSTVEPPLGVEVDEYVQTDSHSGQELARTKEWHERLTGFIVQIQVLSNPNGQRSTSFWLLQPAGSGCIVFATRTFNSNDEENGSWMWRNDPAIKMADGSDLPTDLWPGSVPTLAFVRALGGDGSKTNATVHTQAGSGFATLEVWRVNQTDLKVQAGTFRANKIMMRTDITSVMPSWPSFVLKILQPLLPKSAFYFDAAPPYRFLKQEGAASLGGPDTKTELVRYYTSGPGNAVGK